MTTSRTGLDYLDSLLVLYGASAARVLGQRGLPPSIGPFGPVASTVLPDGFLVDWQLGSTEGEKR